MATTPTNPVQPTPGVPLPAPPTLSDPDNFDERGDAFVLALSPMQQAINALADNAYTNALVIFGKAESAALSANAANTASNQAMGYRNEAGGYASTALAARDAAQGHAASVSSSLAIVDTRLLGGRALPPTTNNQGGAIAVGAMYYNTGSDPTLKDRWYIWGGTEWKLGPGDYTGAFLPLAGGKMLGSLKVRSGATGEEAPQAQEVLPRKVVNLATATADLNLLPHEVMFADGADLTNRPASGDAWHYFFQIPHSSPGYKLQISAGLTANTPMFFRRQVNGQWNTPGGWRRLLDAMDCTPDVKAEGIASSVTDWEVNAGAGAIQQIYISGPIKFWMAPHRRPSETVVLKVQFIGAPHAIAFDAAVIQPKTPIPPYGANDVLTMLFMHRVGTSRYDLYYCGVNLP
ncbi:hypothetical protein [Delftia sp. HK171]|uniref:hypothetical protein n=1 Tax=Delftia sp. HK171 TaxID=1920191 RepID=UPI00115487EC|nr:hypothetical protein [Delftia sp. HK171]TQL73042.1 hypothetical protein FB549_3781 [Delftia sp. HK171]